MSRPKIIPEPESAKEPSSRGRRMKCQVTRHDEVCYKLRCRVSTSAREEASDSRVTAKLE